MTITIRSARADEAGLVLDFVRELAEYERVLNTVAVTESMLAATLFCDHPRVFCDIAEWNGEPAGFALWFPNYASFRGRHGLFLEDLFVRPAYRRRGIGRALFAYLAQRCRSEGWTMLEWAVLDWNKPSIEFYRTIGATLLNDWTICRVTDQALARMAAEGGN